MADKKIDFPLGELNPSHFATKHRPISRNMIIDSAEACHKATTVNLVRPDLFEEAIVFKAVILEARYAKKNSSPLGGLVAGILGRSAAVPSPEFTCMIPEIHAHLPNPLLIEDPATRARVTSYYPKFYYSDLDNIGRVDFRNFTPGSIVEVEFVDQNYNTGFVRSILKTVSNLAPTDILYQAQSIWSTADHPYAGQPWNIPYDGPIFTPEEIKECADNYDNPPPPYNANLNKQANRHHLLDGLHPEFQPFIKCLMWRAYQELGGMEFIVNSTYRDWEYQNRLYQKYLACRETYPDLPIGQRCIPAAAPPMHNGAPDVVGSPTGHSTGMAIDINPRYTNGNTFADGSTMLPGSGREIKPIWQASNFPALVVNMGMVWGGDWETYYDPVHVHAPSSWMKHSSDELRARIVAEGVPANRLPGVFVEGAGVPGGTT
jgi:hypothetical protein